MKKTQQQDHINLSYCQKYIKKVPDVTNGMPTWGFWKLMSGSELLLMASGIKREVVVSALAAK